jgi:hypothetical protein
MKTITIDSNVILLNPKYDNDYALKSLYFDKQVQFIISNVIREKLISEPYSYKIHDPKDYLYFP